MSLLQFIKSKIFLKQLIIAFIALVLFGFILTKWLNITTNHSQKIQVPNLEKMLLKDVEKTLNELDLNFEVIDSASFNPDYPKQSVISQSPEFGDFVKENRKIYLTLNPTGYRAIDFPDIFGKTKRQVTSQLLALGFRINETPIYISDIAKDVVRGVQFNNKEVKAGDKIPQNSLLTLKLGDGEGGERKVETTDDTIE